MLSDLAADLVAITAVMRRTDGPAQQGLGEAAGRIAGLMAMVCTDLGYGREARQTWRTARRLTDGSGSLSARLWVRGNEAVLGLYARRPVDFVLGLAAQGLELADGAATGGSAMLASAQAQGLALLGRKPEAIESLHRVEDLYARLPAELTGMASAFGQPLTRWWHTQSFVHSHAGRTADAYSAQNTALKAYAAASGVGRAQVALHRAACLVRDGSVDEGLSHATATLDGVPAYARGRFVGTVAESVLATVPASEHRRPSVRDYQHAVATMTGRR
jgi:hypothetical protein